MKKIIGFAVTVFTVATLFAAARPSLDGRALVADSGTMPKGLFARTIGYLPGDSVAVTNPATGSTVDVLILGAIDPTEGVAILLSPEAADKLNIKKDSNVQVKITKRAGSLDEAVSGTAMLAEGEDLAYADEGEEAVEEIIGNDIAPITQEYTPGGIVEEYTPDASDSYGVGSTLPTYDYDDMATDYSIPSYTTADDSALTGGYTGTADTDTSQPVIIEYPPYTEETTDTSGGIVEEIPEENAEPFGDTLPTYGDDGVDDYLNGLADSLKAGESTVTEFTPDTLSEPEYSPTGDYDSSDYAPTTYTLEPETVPDVAPAFDAAARSEYYSLDTPSDTASEPSNPVEEIAEEETDTAVASYPLEESPELEDTTAVSEISEETPEPSESAETYQSIVLVPAAERPPVAGTTPVEVTSVPEIPAPAANVAAPVPDVAPAKNAMEDHIVPSLKDLQGGKYYVQIASLGKQENIDAILDKYAEKYPIVLVPLASGASYQVLVGPLNGDEYPVIKEKFKSFGFKDAFLRKIRESVYDPK